MAAAFGVRLARNRFGSHLRILQTSGTIGAVRFLAVIARVSKWTTKAVPSRYCWRTPSAPEARGTLAGGGAKRNHRKRHNRATRPERAPDPGCFCREYWSVAPPGREKSLLVCPGGCAALRHRLISVAPPGREIASLSSPAVSRANRTPKAPQI